MPLTGTLRDLSLPNLVQLQCSEQHHAQVVLTRGSHQGTLVFADGELVYAATDDTAGENAIYELLMWEEGDFRVDTEVHPIEPNVTTPWSALLIEGLRRADEARAERDDALETHVRNLKGNQGVQAALVIRPNGTIRAGAQGDKVPAESAAIIQIVANADRISELWELGASRQILLLHPTGKFLIQKLDDDLFVCWLDGRAPVESLQATLQSFVKQSVT